MDKMGQVFRKEESGDCMQPVKGRSRKILLEHIVRF